jgi:sRNA-binding carbon storage regulator CsrA
VRHGGETLRVAVFRDRRGLLRHAFDGPQSFEILREELVKDAQPES